MLPLGAWRPRGWGPRAPERAMTCRRTESSRTFRCCQGIVGMESRMTGRRRVGTRIGLGGLLLVLLVGGVALAAGPRAGSPDPSFGKGGRVVVPLPGATSPSWFGPIAPAAGGGFLVGYNVSAYSEGETSVIERRQADGALDPTFGREGVVTVSGSISALAEDPSGGVVYAGWTIGGCSRTGPRTRHSTAATRARSSGRRRSPSTRRGGSSSAAAWR